MAEKTIQNEIRELSQGDVRLFRGNAGLAWQGRRPVFRPDGCLVLHQPSRIELLPDGFADLFGWRSMVIKEEHVGQTVAVFVAIEVKTATGKTRKKQESFLALTARAGALSGIAHSVDDAKIILQK